MNYIGYENYLIKSNRKYYYNTNRKIIIKLMMFIFIIIILFFIAFLNKERLEKFFGLNKQLIQKESQVFVLKYSSFDTLEKAYESSLKIKEVGGAGFVKKNSDSDFGVYVASYPTKEKAEKIKQELLKKDLHCEIECINFNAFILKSSEPKFNKYKECLKGHLDNYFLLYEVFESFDNNTLEVVTKQKLNTIYYNYKTKCEELFLEKEKGKELEICSIYINNVLHILDNLVNYKTDTKWSLQYSLIKLAYEYQSMLKAIS